VSEANPRVEEGQRYALRQGLPDLPAPLPGRGGYLASFWRETKDPEGVQQDSPGRKPWVQGPNCGKP